MTKKFLFPAGNRIDDTDDNVFYKGSPVNGLYYKSNLIWQKEVPSDPLAVTPSGGGATLTGDIVDSPSAPYTSDTALLSLNVAGGSGNVRVTLSNGAGSVYQMVFNTAAPANEGAAILTDASPDWVRTEADAIVEGDGSLTFNSWAGVISPDGPPEINGNMITDWLVEDLDTLETDSGSWTTTIQKTQDAPITATVMFRPTQLSQAENGTLPDLQNTNVPGGHDLANMDKSWGVRIFGISGGDGGPYTVDYNLTVAMTASETCPNGNAIEDVTKYINDVISSVPANETSSAVTTVSNVSPNWTGDGNRPGFTESYDPNVNSGVCSYKVTGTIEITDATGNNVILAIDGSEGSTTQKSDGSSGSYTDNFQWGNTNCVPN